MGSLDRQREEGMPKRRNKACKNAEVWQVVYVWSFGQEPKWRKICPIMAPVEGKRWGRVIPSQGRQNSDRKRPQILIPFQVGSPTCKKSFGHLHKVFILGIPPGIVTSLVPGKSDSYASVIKSVNILHTYPHLPLWLFWELTDQSLHVTVAFPKNKAHCMSPYPEATEMIKPKPTNKVENFLEGCDTPKDLGIGIGKSCLCSPPDLSSSDEGWSEMAD